MGQQADERQRRLSMLTRTCGQSERWSHAEYGVTAQTGLEEGVRAFCYESSEESRRSRSSSAILSDRVFQRNIKAVGDFWMAEAHTRLPLSKRK